MRVDELQRLWPQAGEERVHVPPDEEAQKRQSGRPLHRRCRDRLFEILKALQQLNVRQCCC